MVLSLRVTHESKHRRNITYFGPTTLRATVCYNLIKLAEPKTGDIIIDPMCGGGSIPIEVKEAALFLKLSFISNCEKCNSDVTTYFDRPLWLFPTLLCWAGIITTKLLKEREWISRHCLECTKWICWNGASRNCHSRILTLTYSSQIWSVLLGVLCYLKK